MFNPENLDPSAEKHLVMQGFRVVGVFPGMTEAENRAASLAPGSPDEVWVVHIISDYKGWGSICFTSNFGSANDYKAGFHPDDNLYLWN